MGARSFLLASVFSDDSDVPEHEGPAIHPAIDLQRYKYPLSKADQKQLATCLLGGIPALLDQAKINLNASNARDLWLYAGAVFRGQSQTLQDFAKSDLAMRTLEGEVHADLTGADAALTAAIENARAATDAFADWVEAQAANKSGSSGVGKAINYNWYMKNVHLVPYDWDEQVTVLRRELDRLRAPRWSSRSSATGIFHRSIL
ncbi:MAG: hypothetical protein U1E87_10140 [Alphaproteobacteria bacterium]